MKQHKHAELIKQWADGAEIEWYSYFTEEWYDVSLSPAWDDDIEFRIKPKAKWTPKYRRIAAYKDGICTDVAVPKAVCIYYIIQQFVEEFETDWGNQCCEVFKSSITNEFTVLNMNDEISPSLGAIVMSKKCAKKLCEMLNNGEIEL